MSTCTETAPCFACLRCAIQLANLIPEAAKKAARAHPSADDFGPLPPAPKQERRYLGASSIPTIYEAFKSHVATLPDGSRVELPAGTVLREGTLPPEIEPTEPRTLGEQLHEEHDRAAHADGSPCLCDPAEGAILADLTERVGLPREMAPSVGPACNDPNHAPTDWGPNMRSDWLCGSCGTWTKNPKGTRTTFDRTIRPEHMPPPGLEDGAVLATVGPEGAIVPADPDPWLAGLTITTANAIRSGIDRGLPAKAGVAAVIAAFQAGVDMAIDPPRCTGKRPANAGTTGIECDDTTCPRHGTLKPRT